MTNGLFFTLFFSIEAMKIKSILVLHSKQGFINNVFCRNWAVRYPAGTRLGSSSLVNKQVVQGGAEMVGARVQLYQRDGTQGAPQNVDNVLNVVNVQCGYSKSRRASKSH